MLVTDFARALPIDMKNIHQQLIAIHYHNQIKQP